MADARIAQFDSDHGNVLSNEGDEHLYREFAMMQLLTVSEWQMYALSVGDV